MPIRQSAAASEQCFDVSLDFLRGHLGFETFHHIARAIHQELCKVPADVTRVRGFQLTVQITRATAVHFDLREEREVHVIFAAGELQDLGIAAGFLRTKLVAWEAQYGKPAGLMVFLQSTQTCVLGSESSLTRDVHGQPHFVLKLGKGDRFTRDGRHFNVVNIRHDALIGNGGGIVVKSVRTVLPDWPA